MGMSITIPPGWCLGVASRAASRPPPGLGCPPPAALHGAEPATPLQCLNPLLAVPGAQCVRRAMGHIIAAPVDMFIQASPHCKPRVVSWKFGSPAHQQCAIIDCPREALEMADIIHIQQGQGIEHAGLLHPMPSLSTPLCR